MVKKAVQGKIRKPDSRSRTWTFVVYPESLPTNWRDILDSQHIKWIEGPCHDKDTNPDGEIKKSHIHLILIFNSKKSFNQVLEISKKLNSPVPQKVADISGMVRYLVHMDNPEKYQYSPKDIREHGGADVMGYLTSSRSDKTRVIAEMCDCISREGFTEFSDFEAYVRQNHYSDWYSTLVTTATIVISTVITSARHKAKNEIEKEKEKEK